MTQAAEYKFADGWVMTVTPGPTAVKKEYFAAPYPSQTPSVAYTGMSLYRPNTMQSLVRNTPIYGPRSTYVYGNIRTSR